MTNNQSQGQNFSSIFLFIALLFFLSNCTPARMVKDNFDKNVKTSKVKISRESKIIFIAVPTIFGYDNQDKVSLRNGDNLEIDVPLGTHEFFVRSNQADRPAKLSAKVEEGKSLCFVINPEPKPVIKFIIFPIFWFTHTFRIEQEESLCR